MSSPSLVVFRRRLGIANLGFILTVAWASAGCVASAGDGDIVEVGGALSSPAPLFTVVGETQAQANSIPPDSNGAVSPSFIVTTVNSFINVKNRSGALLFSQRQDDFWAPVAGPNAGSFDPQARFDAAGGRFILSAATNAFDGVNARLLIAVSQTSDPTGAWHRFAIQADPARLRWLDFPQLGYNRKWIVVGGLNVNTGPELPERIQWVFDKAALYAGTNSFQRLIVDPAFTPLRPAETYDNASDDQFFMRGGFSSIELWRLSGPVGSAVLGMVAEIPSPTPVGTQGEIPIAIPQAGGQPTNLGVANFSMEHVVFRNGSIWGVQSIVPDQQPPRASVQWVRVSPNGALQSFGLVDDPTAQVMFLMPSIAVNANNDFLIGYSRFSGDTFPSAAYSAHLPGDAPSSVRDPLIYRAGLTPYFVNRWGDFSHTQVDPVNNLDFWTIQETTVEQSTWATWWAQVSGGAPPVCPSGVTSPRLNLQARCSFQGQQSMNFGIRVFNWSPAPVTIGSLCVKSWAFEPAALNLSQWNNGSGQVCTAGGSCTNVTVGGRTAVVANVPACTTNPTHKANQSVTYCTTSPLTIPANGGFWQTQADGLRIGRNNPTMSGGNFADDYSHFGTGNADCAAFSTFADNSFFDLYFNGGLVGEALSATAGDPNTGREPCTCQ